MTPLQMPTVSSNELIKAWRKIWNEKEYTNIDSKKTHLLDIYLCAFNATNLLIICKKCSLLSEQMWRTAPSTAAVVSHVAPWEN